MFYVKKRDKSWIDMKYIIKDDKIWTVPKQSMDFLILFWNKIMFLSSKYIFFVVYMLYQ